jgi:hypothetical protein
VLIGRLCCFAGPARSRQGHEHDPARPDAGGSDRDPVPPEKQILLGAKTIFIYHDVKVVFVDGKVTDAE